jgi:hypothetical protein
MEKKSGMILYLLLAASLLFMATSSTPLTHVAHAATLPSIVITSNVTSLGPSNAVSKNFTVTCTVQNVTNLYGFDMEVGWDNTTLQYISRTVEVPNGTTYPHGILNPPTLPVEDVESDNPAPYGSSVSGAAPGTNYWLAEAAEAPAKVFNGTGTAFVVTFEVKKQPIGINTNLSINLMAATLADVNGNQINCTKQNCTVILYGRPQPAGPTIQISSIKYTGTVPYTFETNVSILNLDSYWDLGGFDVQMSYDPQIMQAKSISIDPTHWFNASWPDGEYAVMNQTDNVNGKVWVALLGLPGPDHAHTPLNGSAVLFTVMFTGNASDPLLKITDPNSLAGFPHPERAELPYNNSELAVPIPYNVTNGLANIIGVWQQTPITGYTVTTESNSSISSLSFQTGIPMISFSATGPDGTRGFCNVTIPKNFLYSTGSSGWIVQVDGRTITPTITTDATNTYLYFTYQQTTHYITIVTSNTIPEFNFIGLIILMMSALAVVLILIKKSPILKKK